MSRYKNLVEVLQGNSRNDVGIHFLNGVETEAFLSYGDLLSEAGKCLAFYQSIGIKTGDELVLLYKSTRTYLIGVWACLLGGMIPVPLTFPENVEDTLKIFTIWQILKKPWIAADDHKLFMKLEAFSAEKNMNTIFKSMTSGFFCHMDFECGGQEPYYPNIHPKDNAFIQFSSGSTGNPKGILLTHENVLTFINDTIESSEICGTDSFLAWVPITHGFGMIYFHLIPLVAGVQQYRIPTSTFVWNPEIWFSAIHKYRVSITGTPNFGLSHFLKKFNEETAKEEQWDLSCVKYIVSVSERISASLCNEFTEKLEKYQLSSEVIMPAYGLSEATGIVATCLPREPVQAFTIDRSQMKPGQKVRFVDSTAVEAVEFVDCGPPLKHTQIRITDGSRNPLEEDTIGHVEVKGICITPGYYGNPGATREILSEDGWLDTKDLGFLHNGRLVIVGRIKEMIIIGGINYMPQDIEQAIYQRAGINELKECVACGVPNPETGTEDLVIFVPFEKEYDELLPLAENICLQVLNELGLNVAHVLPVKQLPKTNSGKIRRFKLVQAYQNGEFDEFIRPSKEGNQQILLPASIDSPVFQQRQDTIMDMIRKEVEVLLGHGNFNINDGFTELGLSSVKLMMLQERLEKRLEINMSSTAVLDYPSIGAMAAYLAKSENTRSIHGTEDAEPVEDMAVAVVGIACRFPGGASSPEALWQLLDKGVDPVREIPEWRFIKDPGSQEELSTRMGGFLEDIDKFDPLFFGISPTEAETLDPQHRLLLELTWEALEDAGWNPRSLRGSRTGVFVGISSSDYAQVGRDLNCSLGPYTLTGTMLNGAAGRISYAFDLHGPSMAIETACSSSLVAVHQGVMQLRTKKCDTALAAGVNLILRAGGHASFTKLQALSPSGRCRSFDEEADGYIRSEGGAVVVLKRLEDARKDGDQIWGIIRGTAVNHNGHSSGFTVPSGPAQGQLIREALSDAGLEPEDIDYLEAHGSATRLGDPQEVNALAQVFGGRKQPLYIGSIKSNLGHTEAAAGLAGLCKVLLAMKHGRIPANLHFNKGNPLIPWDTTPIKVVEQHTEWKARNGHRRAGISSFGISGINSHIIVEALSDVQENSSLTTTSSSNLFTISAQTEAALRAYTSMMADWCQQPTAEIAALCRTLALGRAPLKRRLVLPAEDMKTLAQQLQMLADSALPLGVDAPDQPDPLVFLFTGQGSQYHKMAEALYQESSVFKEKLDELDKAFRAHIDESLIELIYGDDNGALKRPLYAQPLIFSIEVALAHYWESLGIVPDIVIGHSIGEYAAAFMAGTISLKDAVYMVAARGEIMDATPPHGGMVGVLAEEEKVKALIQDYQDVSVAAVNAPENITVSGGKASIEDIVQRARKERIFVEELEVSHPFHSVMMNDRVGLLESTLEKVVFHRPCRCFISTCTGAIVDEETRLNSAYWGQHLVKPVLFSKAINTALSAGGRVFLEIGATATLSGLAAQNIEGDNILLLPSLRKNKPVFKQIQETLGELWKAGYAVNWKGFYKGKAIRIENLPHTPYERRRVWLKEGEGTVSGKTIQSLMSVKESAAACEITSVNGNTVEIQEALRDMVSQVTGVSRDDIENSLNLFSLGLDSLMLVQMSKNIVNQFQVDIPVKIFFAQLHTIELLAKYILSHRPDTTKENNTSEANLADEGVHQIINRQLAIMEAQLRLIDPTQSSEGGNISVKPLQRIRAVSQGPSVADNTSSRSIQLTEDDLTPRQQQFLDDFIVRWTSRTQRSKAYAAENREGLADWIMSLNFSRSIKELVYPVVSAKSKGARFWDIDGNEYIDTAMGYGVSFFGHRPDFITEAIHQQLDQGFELGPQSSVVGEVTDQIRRLTGVERVAYCNTGTEAVMVALRLARTVSGRNKIVRFIASFHGSFDGVLAEADGEASQPMAPGIPQSMVDDTIVLQYGSPESLEILQKHGKELAAVLVEPVQSRNPGLQPKEYLHKLRAICSEQKIALIFDEMVTGFRIDLGGAQAYFNVEADMVTYGKLVGGGMPIGIVAGKSLYLDAVDGGNWSYGDESSPRAKTTFFAGTFCKHPLTMAACKAVLKRLEEEGANLIKAANERTSRFVEQANQYFLEAQVPLKTLQFGSMYRFETKAATDMSLFPLAVNLFFRLMMEAGIYVWERRTCFFSTAHTDEDAAEIVKALRYSVETLREGGFEFRAVDGPQGPNSTHGSSKSNETSFELSSEERRVYILSSLKGGNQAYQVPYLLMLSKPPNIDGLQDAFKVIAEKHEMLRSCFRIQGGAVVHHIVKTLEPEFLWADARKGDSLERFEAQWKRPFDLSQAPLWRWGLSADEEGCYRLVFNFHHIIFDGPSMDVILDDLKKVVNGIALEKPAQTYRDYVKTEKLFLTSPEASKERDYWMKSLSPLPPALNLPGDGIRPDINNFKGSSKFFRLDSQVLHQAKELARKFQTTHFMVFLAAWAAFIGKLADQRDFCIGIPWNKRNNENMQGVVGMFAQTLVLRLQPRPAESFTDFLLSTREMCLGAYGNSQYPLDRLLEDLNVPRDLGRNPLFDVMFIYENGQQRTIEFGGITSEPGEVSSGHATFDLTLEMIERNNRLFCSLNYAVPLFSGPRMEDWIQRFISFLNEVLHDPSQLLGNIPLMSRAEATHLLSLGNGPVIDQGGLTVTKILHEAFRQYADKPAVWFKGKEITYRELEIRAKAIGARLLSYGVGREEIVGILLDRSPDMLAALLGVLKAGVPWLPLDLSYPEERIRYMLEQSRARLLLTKADSAKSFKFSIPFIDPENIQENESCDTADNTSCPEDLAYLIFTSGSTGKPKGVELEQGSLANFLVGMARALDWEPESRTACLTTASFDIFLLETLLCLAQGGCVVLGDETESTDPTSLDQMIRRGQVDYLQMTPTRLQLLSANEKAFNGVLGSIKKLIVGGEAFPKQLLPLLNSFKGLKIFNVYGPTETCVWSTCKELAPDHEVSIGLPIDNTRIYILDSYQQLVPPGVEGDLWIAGAGVARGYLDNPELTGERFVKDPFTEGKMYRTGDRAKWDEGEIKCLGRNDDQVKIRGYRIELGEIEQVLKKHPAVANAAVAVQELELGNKVLTGFCQPKPEKNISQKEIKTWAAQYLPDYMVPASIQELIEIPQTQNGKVNRKALSSAKPMGHSINTTEPRSQLDDTLMEIWKKFLGDRPIGINDSFFDLGGNSFSLVLMQAELEKIYPGLVSVADIFANPTILRLRQFIHTTAYNGSKAKQGIIPLASSWFENSLGTEGRITLDLTRELILDLRELAADYQISFSEIIMATFALYLNKALNRDSLCLWLLGISERAAPCSFEFNQRLDFGEILSELSASTTLPDNFIATQTLSPSAAEDCGVRIGFSVGLPYDRHRLFRHFDLILSVEEAEKAHRLGIEYNRRLNGEVLQHHLNLYAKLLYLIVGKSKEKERYHG